MDLVVADAAGKPLFQTDDYSLDLQYGSKNDFKLSLPETLDAHWRFQIDGTPYGGILDTPCPTKSAKGSSIAYEGRSLQGVFEKKTIFPPSGQSHLVFKGDANAMLADFLKLQGLEGDFEAEPSPSGLPELNYRFYRYVNGWKGLRMALASVGGRLDVLCRDGLPLVRAVPSREYGRLDSERVYFDLKCETLPCNRLTGLGKGEGVDREVCEWFADLFGNVSKTQTLFGVWENAETYSLNAEEGSSLSAKTKAKLLELQEGSKAEVDVPQDVSLDVGDIVAISSSEHRLEATTQVTDVVVKVANGRMKRSYRFGTPDFPDEEEE